MDVESSTASVPDTGGGAIGRITGAIRRVNRWLHYLAGGVLLALMSVTIVDIAGRYLFNSPFSGTVELTQMAMIVLVYLGFAHAEDQGDHIAVDILYVKLGRGGQLALTLFNGVFGLFVVGLLTWNLYSFAGILDGGGYTTAVLDIPQGRVALIGVGGAVMFVLAMASTVALALRAVLKDHA